jgi:hypothetical protein
MKKLVLIIMLFFTLCSVSQAQLAPYYIVRESRQGRTAKQESDAQFWEYVRCYIINNWLF